MREQAPIELRIRVEEGTYVHVRVIGSGPPVIVPLACWCEEYDVLASSNKLVLYDPRGRGQSSAVGVEQVSFEADLKDLELVQAALNLTPAALIGWSYFGGVVARYAMLHPQRVSRLVLVGGTPVRGGEFMAAVMREQARRLGDIKPDNPAAFWDAFVQTRSGQQPPWPGQRSKPSQYENEKPERVFPLVTKAMASMCDWDWRSEAKRIQCPVLVVEGSEDILPREAAAEWTAALPDARSLILEGVGHFPSLEDPGRFFPAVGKFLLDLGQDLASLPRR